MNERLERIDASIAKQLSRSMTVNAELQLRIDALKIALRFYACAGHWTPDATFDPNSSRFEGPNIARAALDKDAEQ